MRDVAFVIPGALDTPTGGYGYDRRLVAGLPRQGWPVRVVSLDGAWPFPSEADRRAAAAALAGLPDGTVVLGDALAFSAMADTLAAEAGRLRLVALVHHPLGDEGGLAPEDSRALMAAETAALAAVRQVVVTSVATGRRLETGFAVPAARITVAPPGTEPGVRAAGDGSPPLIVSVGSLIPRKRHDVLVAALAALANRAWRARIIGSEALDPACAATLRAQVAATGLADRVTLVGATTDTRAELAAADVFVLASEYEGYGMAFAEALSQGLPVVACRAGAIADLVPEAAGALVPPGDASALAAALAGLLDNPAARARAAEAAWTAGQALPTWDVTCALVAGALGRADAG